MAASPAVAVDVAVADVSAEVKSQDDLNSDLWHACMTGDVDEAAAALEAGADADHANSHGMRPLIVCSGGMGPPRLMKMLLNAGASVDAKDRSGWTPLVYVSSSGQMPLLQLLLEYGADVNVVCESDGWTPLTRAAYRGQASVVRCLLDKGADTTAVTNGRTAQQWAVEQGHEEVASILQACISK